MQRKGDCLESIRVNSFVRRSPGPGIRSNRFTAQFAPFAVGVSALNLQWPPLCCLTGLPALSPCTYVASVHATTTDGAATNGKDGPPLRSVTLSPCTCVTSVHATTTDGAATSGKDDPPLRSVTFRLTAPTARVEVPGESSRSYRCRLLPCPRGLANRRASV